MKITTKFLSNIKKAPSMYYLISIIGISNGFVLPFLKQINIEITNSYFTIALGEAMFIITLALVGLIWGLGFDNIRNPNVAMFIALEGVAISLYLTSIVSTPIGYLICRLSTAFFASATYPFIIRIVADKYHPGNRIYAFLSAMVLINCTTGIGATLAYILSFYMKWRAIIVLYAILVSLSPLIILLARILEKKNDLSNNSDCIMNSIWSDKEAGEAKIIAIFKRIFKTRTNTVIMIQGIFGCIPWGALGLFLLYAIAEKLNTSFIVAGLILALSGAFYPFSLILVPKIDNLRKNKQYELLVKSAIFAIFAQAIIYVLAIRTINFSSEEINSKDILAILGFLKNINVAVAVILFGLLIIVSSLVGPITRNIIVDVNHSSNRATSLTIIRLFENIGSATGLIIGGILVDIYGSFYIAVEYVCIFWLICALIWIPLVRIYPREIVDSETK